MTTPTARRPLPLETTIVYGPIVSRRLGRSLGLNLLPIHAKVCSFDCVYCHYGDTDVKVSRPVQGDGQDLGFPNPGDVAKAVERALRTCGAVDSLTFSGNGEPTLYPYFAEIAFEVRRLRDRYCPGARIALFSNATTLMHPGVQAALQHIDRPILKLDAGDAMTLTQVNRPAAGVNFAGVVEALHGIRDLTLQTVLFDGPVTNASGDAFEAWLRTVTELKPTQIQIYSTDYPVPDATIQRVPAFRLRELAGIARHRTGAQVQAYWPA